MNGKRLFCLAFMVCLLAVCAGAFAEEGYCVEIQLLPGVVNVGNPYQYVKTLDENGEDLGLPIQVMRGSAICTVVDGPTRRLHTTDTGTVLLAVKNPDGTAVSRLFEIYETPEKVYLNAEELHLNIGDTFDFEVTFDKGNIEYQLYVSYDDHDPEDGLYCVKLSDHHLVAQAPGTARVWVYCGVNDYRECRITVSDGDKKVHLVGPEGAFGIGDTFQMYVEDKTGKRYPAVFRREVTAGSDGAGRVATVTEDGLLTGVETGAVRVYALLEDGRELNCIIDVVKKPEWISHPDLSFPVNYDMVALETITSDVGTISSLDVDVAVADETVAVFDGYFRPIKEGSTQVILTAKNGGAQTEFTLTVEKADDTLYPETSVLHVADGYWVPFPKVTDYYGNEEKVTWEIVHQSQTPAAGDVYPLAFRTGGTRLYCNWPYASCTVVGTAADGRTVQITGFGYRQAKDVVFRYDPFTVLVGEEVQIDVSAAQDADGTGGYQTGPLSWSIVEGKDVISFTESSPQTGMPTATGLKSGTAKLKVTMTTNGVFRTCIVLVQEKPVLPGDVNQNGTADEGDVTELLWYLAEWGGDTDPVGADLNGDGTVSVQDALLLLRARQGV